jgi:hypothetical protein
MKPYALFILVHKPAHKIAVALFLWGFEFRGKVSEREEEREIIEKRERSYFFETYEKPIRNSIPIAFPTLANSIN